MITEGELYQGGKMENGVWRALTPGEIQWANDFYYPKPKPGVPKPPQQLNATMASVGKTVKQPSNKKKPVKLSDLRSRKKLKINNQISMAMGGIGAGLNIGGVA